MYQPMASGNAPAPPKRSVLDISELRGVDLFNAPANVDDSRSPDAPNMIRDVPGKVRKRMGYEQTDAYDGRINGVFYLLDEEGTHRIVHAGTKLYDGETVIYEDMNDTRSKAWQFDQKLYLLDGKTYLVYGLLEDKEAAVMLAATADKSYHDVPHELRDKLRANIFKQMLISSMK